MGKRRRIPFWWLVWHPYKGLWNGHLVGLIHERVPLAPARDTLIWLIVQVDTLCLFARVLATRIRRLGIRSVLSKATVPDSVPVLYLDLGLHREGEELAWVAGNLLPKISNRFEAFGLEARRDSFLQVHRKLGGLDNVRIVHTAVCYPAPSDGKIKLYIATNDGMGDSIHRPGTSYEVVPGTRLTDFLEDNNIALGERVTLLRMNIEGAEYDVINDLIDSGNVSNIDGYSGTWDDMEYIDTQRAAELRSLVKQHRIYRFPFSGQDLKWPVRTKCIEYYFRTQVLLGQKRLENSRRRF
jgi:hypothetical protein